MDKDKEIKKLLSGQYRTVDGINIAIEEMKLKNFIGWQGIPNGAENVSVLGFSSETLQIESDGSLENPLQELMRLLIRYGKLTALANAPDAVGFLDRNNLSNVVLYVIEEKAPGSTIEMSVYTAKGAAAPLTLRRAVKTVIEQLPDGLSKVETEAERKKREKKEQRKEGR